MIPPKPEFNASHVIDESGRSVPMNLWQRLEAKLDHLIECAHANPEPSVCPDCRWPKDHEACCTSRPQEVS